MWQQIYVWIFLALSAKLLFSSEVADLNFRSEIPEMIKSVEKITVEGKSTTLQCNTQISDGMKVKWFFKGHELVDNRLEINSNGFLYIKAVTMSDAGEYTCCVANEQFVNQMSTLLIVRKRTVIADWTREYTATVGEMVRLSCNVLVDPTAKYEIDWRKGKDKESITRDYHRYVKDENDNSLIISNVQVSDSDKFSCVVYTKYDKTKKSTKLIVKPQMPGVPLITFKCAGKIATIKYQLNEEILEKFMILIQYRMNNGTWTNDASLEPPAKECKLQMRPWKKYEFRVLIFYPSGRSDMSKPSEPCFTPPDIPSERLSDFKVEETGPTSISVLWQPILPIDHNGPGFRYIIQWIKHEDGTHWNEMIVTEWGQNNVTIENLSTFAFYTVRIRAANAIGESQSWDIKSVRSGQGKPTKAPTNFKITNTNSTSVRMVWDAVPLRYINGYPNGYKIFLWKSIDGKSVFNTYNIEYDRKIGLNELDWKNKFLKGVDLIDLRPGTNYSAAIAAFNDQCYGPYSRVIKFQTPEGIPDRVQSFFPISIGPSSISLKWIGPKQSNGQIIGYIIYYDELENQRNLKRRISDVNEYELDGLRPNTTYRLSISAFTSAGEGERFTIESRTTLDEPFKLELLPIDDQFVSLQVNWRTNITITTFFAKYRLKDDEEWIKTENMSVRSNSNELIKLERDRVYEIVVVMIDNEREITNESGIIEIATKIEEMPTENFIQKNAILLISIISIVVLIFVIAAIWLFFIYLRHKQKIKVKHDAEYISKQSEIDFGSYIRSTEGADLLSHFERYEFPREKLVLGEKLGSGAFGIVVAATALGILPNEDETRVAVKMVKKTANDEMLHALALELKMFIRIGKHLNVVNLLGAITKNFANRELMVIVEYCPHGNLRDFLVEHRDYFIDQIIQDEDKIDPSITNCPKFDDFNTNTGYKPHFQPTRTVTTTDLLCWSFQIARGMDYLAAQSVFHGDLAARNILLCDNNVVKICDFGLARSMYTTGEYHIKTDRPLPFKWLALESMSDQVFSTYSDVWSFGIVLWELFTLGTNPYPGIDAGQTLFETLKDGHRMKKPEYATMDIYNVMLSCWRVTPESRPLFGALEQTIVNLMDRRVGEHYVELNEPYLKQNSNCPTSKETDYFALMGCPDVPSPSIPKTYLDISQEFERHCDNNKRVSNLYVSHSILENASM